MGYLIARALTDGNVTLEAFTGEAVKEQDGLTLVDRVKRRFDPTIRGRLRRCTFGAGDDPAPERRDLDGASRDRKEAWRCLSCHQG